MTAPASSQSIVARAVEAVEHEEQITKAYAAGKRAYQLKQAGQPFLALVEHWTHFAQPAVVRRAFFLGVEDA